MISRTLNMKHWFSKFEEIKCFRNIEHGTTRVEPIEFLNLESSLWPESSLHSRVQLLPRPEKAGLLTKLSEEPWQWNAPSYICVYKA